jgi:hypothetical protein
MSMVKTADEVYSDIRERFVDKTGDEPGAVLELFTSAIADEDGEIYRTIENNKTPHVWSKLEGQDLDDTGTWVNVPRDVGESDASYKYRLMQWKHLKETANATAVDTALLNPEFAADLKYVPLTHGAGTGTCYVIPKQYTEESIMKALKEAEGRIKKSTSCGAYVEYIVPEMRAVMLECYLKTTTGDETAIKNQITDAVRTYVNGIAPGEYLSLGKINKMCVNMSNIEYFAVLGLFIDSEQISRTKVLQQIESKFIFDSIAWIGESDDDNI